MPEDNQAGSNPPPSDAGEVSDSYSTIVVSLTGRSNQRRRRGDRGGSDSDSEYRNPNVDASLHNTAAGYDLDLDGKVPLVQQLSVMTAHINDVLRQNHEEMTEEERRQFIQSTVELSLQSAGLEGCEVDFSYGPPGQEGAVGGEWTAQASNQTTRSYSSIVTIPTGASSSPHNDQDDNDTPEEQPQ
ncbi:hypothetical protein L198_07798 [Cryptococcus wingfieldii CBS 7118]|uniref:Uncharacterized protein n=1 Tax=Cryptococcus wingfieldii CBS 7118 TaxID=1295528 RepID=A0A1E3HYA4_9TREE|nr:hypothetical protein L198_07798 [Cryptococcus wingfieldii CBS 7118]ODN81312.1 hypothetical protein L198_07798 [Cryptococcus wingfieldii CBS 7118]